MFYFPHRLVIRESTQTTKLRIAYDASSKPTKSSTSVNNCLETRPPLQNSMWDILVRSRFKPIFLCGDIKKGFLQIRIQEFERNAFHFHWVNKCDPNHVNINKFTRLVFGLTFSYHFHNYLANYPKIIENISDDTWLGRQFNIRK